MHTTKITPNLLFEYLCTSGKFIRLPNRIEKIDSVARIESNRMETFFSPELECSSGQVCGAMAHLSKRKLGTRRGTRLPTGPWVQENHRPAVGCGRMIGRHLSGLSFSL